jgi:fucose permease
MGGDMATGQAALALEREPVLDALGFRRALAGFFLSGILFAFLGAMLPVWGHHLRGEYVLVGHYFLATNLGVIASALSVRYAVSSRPTSQILALACGLMAAGFLVLAILPPPYPAWWRLGGLFVIGLGGGFLNTGVFRAVLPTYQFDSASTLNLSGLLFSLGCLVTAMLVSGAFYVYTVFSISFFFALIPIFLGVLFYRTAFPARTVLPKASFRDTWSKFRSPTSVLFLLLVLVQFGNEYAVAGWMPLFLIQRLGVSPETALLLLEIYWLSLLVGRVAAQALVRRAPHTRLFLGALGAALLGCLILLNTDNRFGAGAGVIMLGCGFAVIYPLVIEKIEGRFPYQHPGFFQTIFSFGLIGGLLAPWLLGYAAAAWGVEAIMLWPLAGTLVVFLLVLAIWLEAKLTAPPALSADAE